MGPILVTADLHFSDKERDDYRFKFQFQLREIIKDKGVELILVLGDLTEEKDRHSAYLVNRVVQQLWALSEMCEVVIVRGNHDYVDEGAPFFQFVSLIPHIMWVEVPTWGKDLPLPPLHQLGRTLLLPSTRNHKRDWEGLELGKADWILTHNTFDGVKIGHGQVLPGIPPSVIPEGTRVVSGDIHVPQRLDGRITYVGAPYLVDFGDDYEPRVLLFRGDKMTSLRVGGAQKRLVEVKNLAGLAKVQGLTKGDILKVRIGLEPSEHAKWSQMQAEVREWGAKHGYQIHLVQPVTPREERREASGKRKVASRSDEQILREYAAHRGVDEPTVKTGLNLMEGA